MVGCYVSYIVCLLYWLLINIQYVYTNCEGISNHYAVSYNFHLGGDVILVNERTVVQVNNTTSP